MSYLSFLRIQCSMGNDENKVIKYVIFGKREQLTQFPDTRPAVILTGDNEKTEFRPVYLFWDKTDETMVRLCEQSIQASDAGFARIFGKVLSAMAIRHIQSKYKEVFLSNPETLFLSEKAEKEIPPVLWREMPAPREELFLGFGKKEALNILTMAERKTTILFAPGRECRYDEVWEWLLEAESAAGTAINQLFLLGYPEQKENVEDVLERFYNETGIAGSFYPETECRRITAMIDGDVLLLDCLGLPFRQLGRPTYYIDGTGVRTEKEMHRIQRVCKACQSLRNHLDRAFLSAL